VAPAPPPGPSDDRSDRIAALRELAAADPGDATAQFLLGRELLAAHEPLDAAHAFEAAVRAQPDYSAAWRQLGSALEAAGQLDAAARAWRIGVEVASRTGDLQSGKEMVALGKRLARDHGIDPGATGID
jgi:tetratricopeptide (TPR) repeat protein